MIKPGTKERLQKLYEDAAALHRDVDVLRDDGVSSVLYYVISWTGGLLNRLDTEESCLKK